eukprot:TRINITY_DN66477_c0_g1_i1.p1 TRINITY_DN66477_c0_g1~~TRINITY_DN66477_c0_g1_i1.p1  ORF type:complete len:194 (+),score=48.49 TRINITY_DN66477_c0_g1_i1:72-653(+)
MLRARRVPAAAGAAAARPAAPLSAGAAGACALQSQRRNKGSKVPHTKQGIRYKGNYWWNHGWETDKRWYYHAREKMRYLRLKENARHPMGWAQQAPWRLWNVTDMRREIEEGTGSTPHSTPCAVHANSPNIVGDPATFDFNAVLNEKGPYAPKWPYWDAAEFNRYWDRRELTRLRDPVQWQKKYYHGHFSLLD